MGRGGGVKVLFIYPDIITDAVNFCPAVHILSSVLKKEGHETGLLHINKHLTPYNKKVIIDSSDGYDLFAITSTSFNYRYADEIAGWLKDAYPDVLRVLGGSHSTIQPEDFEISNFDVFCIGEGEEPLSRLVYAIENNEDWTKTPRLITRKSANYAHGFLRNLDDLPFWDFDIFETEKIIEIRKGWLSISFSRGCPYNCTFCINHLYRKIAIGPDDRVADYLRMRSPENAVDELESLVNKYNIKFFNIDDDLLTLNRKWMRKFTPLYGERIYKRYGIKYVINIRPALVDDEMGEILSLSGCREARVGFETGNEKLRNELLLKQTSDESLMKAFRIFNKYNIMGVAFAMIGIPGESWNTFNDTISMTIKMQPKLIRMTFLFPYKHTKIYDICIERNLFKDKEIGDNRDYDSILKFEHITDKELFCFRFLFPWYVNYKWFNDLSYNDAILEFTKFELEELNDKIPDIIDRDNELSDNCKHSHYRYYSNNNYYFQLREL